jgi:hypothetical protein
MLAEIVFLVVFLVSSIIGLGLSLITGLFSAEYQLFGFSAGGVFGFVVYFFVFLWAILCLYLVLRREDGIFPVILGYLAFMFVNEAINLVVFWQESASVVYFIRLGLYAVFFYLFKKNRLWFLLKEE